MSFVGRAVSKLTGADKAAESAQQGAATSAAAQTEAARIAAQAQREALEYLKQREALPQGFRENALTRLGGLYGLEGGQGTQQELIDQAQQSPLYAAMMGAREAGEESILRNAAATGGLRSGNVQGAMYDYNTQLQNQALMQSYNQQLQGLQGMAQLPSNTNQIASTMGGIGATIGQGVMGAGNAMAQGQVAAGQAQQAGLGMLLNAGSMAAGAYYSDTRLKDSITPVGELNGHRIYAWVWNAAAEKLGLSGPSMGVLAQEVETYRPDVIGEREGYKTVDYAKLEA